jgi:hypothetical protein
MGKLIPFPKPDTDLTDEDVLEYYEIKAALAKAKRVYGVRRTGTVLVLRCCWRRRSSGCRFDMFKIKTFCNEAECFSCS